MPRASSPIVAVALVLAFGLGATGPRTQGASAPPAVSSVGRPSPTANMSVAIDPATWWMQTGENVTFSATWTGTPAACTLGPTWFRWSAAPEPSVGGFGAASGAEATYYSGGQGAGTATITVRAMAPLDCAGTVRLVDADAAATVTVALPLSVAGLVVEPNPVAPGFPTVLSGTVSGGDPPYQLRVEWGDGRTSGVNVSTPGPFELSHIFGVNGSFAPSVLATDAVAEDDAGTAEERVDVSTVFGAGIDPSSVVAEVGVPETFSVATVAAPPSFTSTFVCGGDAQAGDNVSSGTVYGCVFRAAGLEPVTFDAIGSGPPFPTASAGLVEPVVACPTVAFLPTMAPFEVGRTGDLPLEISGGAPPFTLAWTIAGPGRTGVEPVAADGLVYVPLDPTEPGTFPASAAVVDALGETSPNATGTVEVDPPLYVTATEASEVEATAVAVNISGSVVDGVPPIDWAVVPNATTGNGSVGSGTLAGAGGLWWNATYQLEGDLNVSVVVADADGAWSDVNLTVPLAPGLEASSTVEPAGPDRVTLTMTIAGGLGPYTYRWNDSAGDAWNGTVEGAGTIVLEEATNRGGPLTFDLQIVDALGGTVATQNRTTIETPPAPDPATGPGPSAVIVVALVGCGGAATVVMYRRRRGPPAPAVPADPVAVLREAIEPSDGVDRGMVELLAEEEGVPLDVVRSTLERLKADGTVRAERGDDGEEVLAWSDPPRP